MRSLAKNILKIRKERGWTQQTLADKAKVQKSSISGLESYERCPSLRDSIAIAKVLDSSVDALLDFPFDTKVYDNIGDNLL